MSYSKRILSVFLAVVLTLAVFSVIPAAADAVTTPLLYPKEYSVTAEVGQTVQLKYMYSPAYQNEKILVDIYDSTDTKVGTCERSVYSTSFRLIDYTIDWDTTGYSAGEYTAIARVEFYSFLAWRESPSEKRISITLTGGNSGNTANTIDAAPTVNAGQNYSLTWTYGNYENNSFAKFSVPKRGVATINVSKPQVDNKTGEFDIFVYNAGGSLIWQADTGAQADNISTNYTYKVGLDAGSYVLNIKPKFYFSNRNDSVTSSYSISLKADSNFEIESNNSAATATALTLNKACSGVFGDESYDISYMDFYKINLKKGTEYKVTIGNWGELDEATSTILRILGPNMGEVGYPDSNGFCTFKANKTGTYYIKLYNAGNGAGVSYSVKVSSAVKLNKSKLTLKKGKSFKLKLQGAGKKVKWSSSNKRIAKVNGSGKVKALKKGKCKITAKVGSKKYTCKLTVK